MPISDQLASKLKVSTQKAKLAGTICGSLRNHGAVVIRDSTKRSPLARHRCSASGSRRRVSSYDVGLDCNCSGSTAPLSGIRIVDDIRQTAGPWAAVLPYPSIHG